jgi:hypothetical protein
MLTASKAMPLNQIFFILFAPSTFHANDAGSFLGSPAVQLEAS